MDDRLRELAKASPNFGVLYQHQPLLALYGALAELNGFSNSTAAQVQAGQFGDVLAQELVTRTGLRVAGDRQVDRLRALTDTGALTPESGARRSTEDRRTGHAPPSASRGTGRWPTYWLRCSTRPPRTALRLGRGTAVPSAAAAQPISGCCLGGRR